ncbi:MAG: peptidyl-prolyl cis-trans isomerase [Piscirickettsiaceae bacterium]|nr:peptidyl-prolyl cis-trans isomerase [Piscirickettsiaceae bacterium]
MKTSFCYLATLLLAVLLPLVHSKGGTVLPHIKLETSHGDIIIELNTEKAPNTVANFISYVEDGFYDDTIFHRVIKDFMIQGGGFTEHFIQKLPKKSIKNEADNGLDNVRGSVSMARASEPHSATSQFFINVVDNEFLNFRNQQGSGWGYAVFARVIKGMEVVDGISEVSTGRRGIHQDVPTDDIVIKYAATINLK